MDEVERSRDTAIAPNRISRYKRGVQAHLSRLISEISPVESMLDFGCGDGFYARSLRDAGLVRSVQGVEVREPKHCLIDYQVYEGDRLPFDDGRFQATMAIDVIHHCADPIQALRELARASSRWLILKDHTYSSWIGRLSLVVLDELGNRGRGVKSRYLYQRDWQWLRALAELGWRERRLVHPAACDSRFPFRFYTPRLQFLALFERGP